MKSALEHVAWPPDPIKTERLVLREPEARDRTAIIELLASPEVGGGATQWLGVWTPPEVR